MKSTPIPNTLAHEFAMRQPTLKLEGEDSWLKTLNVGQILKGRIMRQYDNGRYGIHFSGQERIVDSAIALTIGEVLTGRVIGVSEQAVSVKITKQELGTAEGQRDIPVTGEATVNSSSVLIKNYSTGVTLTTETQEIVEKVARGLEYPETVSKVGLYLTKLGLPVTEDLLRALYERVRMSPATANGFKANEKREETTWSATSIHDQNLAVQNSVIQILAESFRKSNSLESANGGEEETWDKKDDLELGASRNEQILPPISSDSGRGGKDFLLSRLLSHLINIQTGAAYQHRLETLPVVIDDRLMEFDVALFDHASSRDTAGVQSKRLKFSLQTLVGVIQLDVSVFNQRVQLQLIAEKSWVAKEFEAYRDHVSDTLREAGWQVDTQEYRADISRETPVKAVIDHVLAQESLGLTI